MDLTVEKRRQTRTKLKGYIADIADGHFIYGGMVEDVSLEGLRLNDLPDKFSVEGKRYSIVISGGPDSPCYKLKVAPRWRRKNGILVDVGFNIAEAPVGWKTFVQNIMPKLKTVSVEEDDHCHWERHTGSSRD
ncbi:PilZ domain-containing protein [Candidatus Electronema sp. PJ]|uniref:PilZ domain-containing protein n=1 Tax=Candidatus Electronema sp. PJ TaxID=3401572 RepID=UPI003AA90571